MRMIVPSLSNAILAFQENRHDWFYDDFPRHFDSLGGRFSNFVFCDGQHRRLSISATSMKSCGKRDFGKLWNRRKGKAASMARASRPSNPATP